MRYFLLLILFPTICFGQKSYRTNDFILKVNATSLIDIFSFPTLQLSLEKRIAKNISLSGEFGYQVYDFRNTDTVLTNTNGMRANIELRIYDIIKKLQGEKENANKITGLYLGINFFYRQNKYNAGLSYNKANDSLTYWDNFAVDKNNWGTNLVLGYQVNILKKIVVDAYVGAGIMKKRLKNSQREISNDDTILGTDLVPLFSSLNLSEHSGWKVNMNFGIRLGILL